MLAVLFSINALQWAHTVKSDEIKSDEIIRSGNGHGRGLGGRLVQQNKKKKDKLIKSSLERRFGLMVLR